MAPRPAVARGESHRRAVATTRTAAEVARRTKRAAAAAVARQVAPSTGAAGRSRIVPLGRAGSPRQRLEAEAEGTITAVEAARQRPSAEIDRRRLAPAPSPRGPLAARAVSAAGAAATEPIETPPSGQVTGATAAEIPTLVEAHQTRTADTDREGRGAVAAAALVAVAGVVVVEVLGASGRPRARRLPAGIGGSR